MEQEINNEKFTQGEWHCKDFNSLNNGVQYIRSDDVEICVLYRGFNVNAPNAHLISQAPAMYRMLNTIAQTITETDAGTISDLLAIEALLSKARGEVN